MQDYPHHYQIAGSATPEGEVRLQGNRLDAIASAPPAEYGGPGDKWSPETLLVAAVADCFILTFRAIAAASKLAWTSLTCEVEGKLERAEGVVRFTEFLIRADLAVPPDTKEDRARRLLEKAEQACLVTNSLSAAKHLEVTVSRGS